MTSHPRILIVKLSAIGDVVHTLPALNALRRHYPQAHISWLVEEGAADLVLGHAALNHVLISRRKTWLKGLRSSDRYDTLRQLSTFVKYLRSQVYDMVFDFQASLKGAVLIALVRSRRKIGFDRGMAHQEGSYLFLNERIPPVSMEIHALTRGLMLLEAIGIPSRSIEYGLPLEASHTFQANALLRANHIEAHQPFIVINPIAKWPTKLWQVADFAEVADHVSRRFDCRVVFTGAREDRSIIEAVMDRMHTSAVNLAGETDLITLAALLQRARMMVTTDTGPMHIAAAMQTPVVALFGPTAPWRTGPFGTGHQIIRTGAACSPCFKRECESCRCMTGISAAQVCAAVDRILRAQM